ncbi:iron complex transport system substrate-binding protein [Oceanotoga teriensis]|uniref:Iron complex transport system substrate-binding protein n=2 Tax=Oceanotoga TaxID=1255275 RepID=A0AA45C9B7_9BACT|nr:ABC transporter substrate-binding protein [Oceanotoga teriensis]PWJ96669.1 iron complex transport system substrate-binding protein [Oceanotoga teriensis]
MKKFSILFIFLLITLLSFAYPYTFTDDSGNVIKVDKPFKRIISLYGGHTENIFYMEAKDSLIAVSTSEAFPPNFKNLPAISYKEDVEKFISLNPDLVLIRPMIYRRYGDLVEKLEAFGITVVSLQPETFDDVFPYWEKLGILTGKIDESKALIKEFELKVNKLPKIEQNDLTEIFFESIHKNFKTTANGSIADYVLKRSGLFNVADEAIQVVEGSTISEFSKEQLIENGDKVEYYIAQKGAMNKISKDIIKNESGFNAIKAVRNDNIIIIDEKIISRPTPRVYYSIVEFYKLIHNDYLTSNHYLYNDEKVSKISFSTIAIDFLMIPFKTPEYFKKEINKDGHLFGDFSDINYRDIQHLYAETAFYNDIVDSKSNKFEPNSILSSNDINSYLSRILNETVNENIVTNKDLIDFLRK